MAQFITLPVETRQASPSLSAFSIRQGQSLTIVYLLAFSSLLIALGGQWDIIWHKSIGRDGLFSPPHILIYIGATVAGISSAWQIMQLTFQRNHPDRNRTVRFWGVFRGTTSALFGVWGSIAMLTSAPFDDWWHSAYGLDVTLLSPPHTLLLTGMMMVQFSAMLSVLTLQNQFRHAADQDVSNQTKRLLRYCYTLTAALVLGVLYYLFSDKLGDWLAHQSKFYIISGILFPVYLVAAGVSAQQRYPMTAIAGLCMIAFLIPSWVFQFIPATPKLAPVLNPIEHFQPLRFPLALVVPAFAMDWVLQRFRTHKNQWKVAFLLGAAFFFVFLLVQWPLSEFFLTSPLARNRVLLAYSLAYNLPPDGPYRYAFHPDHVEHGWRLIRGLSVALLLSIASARAGLWMGTWMRNVVR